jgi:putative two-component system response regulator
MFSTKSLSEVPANVGFGPGPGLAEFAVGQTGMTTGMTTGMATGITDIRHHREEEAARPRVLLVTASETDQRMLGSLLRREGCSLMNANSGAAALEALLISRPHLVIIDRDLATYPEGATGASSQAMDGLECCRRVKALCKSRFVPVLIVAGPGGAEDEVAGIESGADEFLTKPLHPLVFRARIRALIRHKSAIDRLEEAENILFALALTVERRDAGTAGHCQRLALYSVAFGMRLGLSEPQLLALHGGGYLHDIGKIVVPDAILYKPGKLTVEEWAVMKTHSVRGEEICRPMHSLDPVLPIIRNHHERWDGTGYPDGLEGDHIPLLARVLQLADAFDALTSERPYKPAFSRELALQTLVSEGERGWRERELTRLFVDLPFDELKLAEEHVSQPENTSDFASSVRNLQHHLAIAS